MATAKYPVYRDRVVRIAKLVKAALRIVDVAMGLDPKITGTKRLAFLAHAAKKFDLGSFERRLLNEFDELLVDQKKILAASFEAQRNLRFCRELLLAIGVAANIALAFSLGAMFVTGITKRLALLSDNFDRYAKGAKLHAPFKDQDEIGQFDRSFRTMTAILTESARKERAIIENASDIICSLDKSGYFVKVNPACEFVWGFSAETLISKPLTEFVLPEDRPVVSQFLDMGMRGDGREFEFRMTRRDGNVLEMLWSARWSEQEQSIFCVAHDITERKMAEATLKASEQRVRAMLDNMLVGVITARKDGVIESINAKMEEISGYSIDEIEGRQIGSLFAQSFAASDSGSPFNSDQRQAANEDSLASVEDEIKHKSGHFVPVELSQTEFQAAEGQRFLVNVFDISERRAIEKMKQEFVAMVTHDLRTPLTSIGLFLDLLDAGVYATLTDEGDLRVQQAIQNASSVLLLINDLLDITSLESGKLNLQLDRVSLKELFQAVLVSVESSATSKEINIDSSFPELFIEGDFSRLERVATTLVSQAIDASPRGESVFVSTNMLKDQIEIRVKDNGQSITEEQKATLFDRLARKSQQDDQSRKAKESGLGLAICKAIVEQHGGKIGIETDGGTGNTFWFTLPRSQKDPTEEASA